MKSGSLVAPGLPQVADKALMSKIVNTYGKTWHTWHTDRDKTLPMGIPALMMGFTGEGQLDPVLLADRDRRLGIDSKAIKRERQDLPAHPVITGANAWEEGRLSSYSACGVLASMGEAIRPISALLNSRENNFTFLQADTKKKAYKVTVSRKD